jgi:hypothetical protein
MRNAVELYRLEFTVTQVRVNFVGKTDRDRARGKNKHIRLYIDIQCSR